jgi:hypothetical protein
MLVSNGISLTCTEFGVTSLETLRASRKGYQTMQFDNIFAAILGRIESIRHRPEFYYSLKMIPKAIRKM